MEKTREEDYISLLKIFKKLWNRRRFLMRIVIAFFLFGLFIAIFSPNEYTSKIKFLSQTSSVSKVSGKWSGIAALVGVNLSTGVDNEEIPTNIYPKIISSISFQRDLMETKLNFKNNDSAISFKNYYNEHIETDAVTVLRKYTIGLPKTIVEAIKDKKSPREQVLYLKDSLVFIDFEEQKLRKLLRESLIFSIDETDGVISIAVTLNEAIPAAQLAQSAHELLQKEIISYRTAKAQNQMDFIQKQFDEQIVNFKTAQYDFASYKDRNRFNITQISQIEYQKLQSEYDLSYTVFSELQRQLVAQQIQVNKDTPVFTTINEAIVPVEISNPKGVKTLITFIVLGFMFAVMYGLATEFLKKFKATWKKVV